MIDLDAIEARNFTAARYVAEGDEYAGFTWDSARDVPDLVAEVRRLRSDNDALRARVAELERLVKGDTTPPTDAEIDAHDGPWWIVLDHAAGFAARCAEGDEAKMWAKRQRERGAVFVWRAFHASTGELVPRASATTAPSATATMGFAEALDAEAATRAALDAVDGGER